MAKRVHIFKNIETGRSSMVTDLQLRKQMRLRNFELFENVYLKPFKEKKVSIFLIAVEKEKYDKVSSFFSDFKKKLLRKGIKTLGYIWQQDIGDVKFKKHFHIMLVTPRLPTRSIKELLINQTEDRGYGWELCKSVIKFRNYLKKKELYAEDRRRAFGKSNYFKLS